MGRTLPTIVQTLHAEEERWKGFRRALRKEDQEAFDELWRWARRHVAPASMVPCSVPFEAFLIGMIVGLCREVQELKKNHGAP